MLKPYTTSTLCTHGSWNSRLFNLMYSYYGYTEEQPFTRDLHREKGTSWSVRVKSSRSQTKSHFWHHMPQVYNLLLDQPRKTTLKQLCPFTQLKVVEQILNLFSMVGSGHNKSYNMKGIPHKSNNTCDLMQKHGNALRAKYVHTPTQYTLRINVKIRLSAVTWPQHVEHSQSGSPGSLFAAPRRVWFCHFYCRPPLTLNIINVESCLKSPVLISFMKHIHSSIVHYFISRRLLSMVL